MGLLLKPRQVATKLKLIAWISGLLCWCSQPLKGTVRFCCPESFAILSLPSTSTGMPCVSPFSSLVWIHFIGVHLLSKSSLSSLPFFQPQEDSLHCASLGQQHTLAFIYIYLFIFFLHLILSYSLSTIHSTHSKLQASWGKGSIPFVIAILMSNAVLMEWMLKKHLLNEWMNK